MSNPSDDTKVLLVPCQRGMGNTFSLIKEITKYLEMGYMIKFIDIYEGEQRDETY